MKVCCFISEWWWKIIFLICIEIIFILSCIDLSKSLSSHSFLFHATNWPLMYTPESGNVLNRGVWKYLRVFNKHDYGHFTHMELKFLFFALEKYLLHDCGWTVSFEILIVGSCSCKTEIKILKHFLMFKVWWLSLIQSKTIHFYQGRERFRDYCPPIGQMTVF